MFRLFRFDVSTFWSRYFDFLVSMFRLFGLDISMFRLFGLDVSTFWSRCFDFLVSKGKKSRNIETKKSKSRNLETSLYSHGNCHRPLSVVFFQYLFPPSFQLSMLLIIPRGQTSLRVRFLFIDYHVISVSFVLLYVCSEGPYCFISNDRLRAIRSLYMLYNH